MSTYIEELTDAVNAIVSGLEQAAGDLGIGSANRVYEGDGIGTGVRPCIDVFLDTPTNPNNLEDFSTVVLLTWSLSVLIHTSARASKGDAWLDAMIMAARVNQWMNANAHGWRLAEQPFEFLSNSADKTSLVLTYEAAYPFL